jgi:hypothetical protein
MNVIIQTALGLTDISSLVGFWRIKCLKKGIGVVVVAYGFILIPLIASMLIGGGGDLSGEGIIVSSVFGLIGMVGFRMFFLYEWTKRWNAQNSNTFNSDLQ